MMPFQDGKTLRARLDREKQLPVDEALRITAALPAALQCAHDRALRWRATALRRTFKENCLRRCI